MIKLYQSRATLINLLIVVGLLLVLYQHRYGLGMLNPTYDGWLMKHDWATHYLGWFFYRNEPWGFPLGAIANYLYPVGTNVGFTDSIPLAAILLKIFSPVLPTHFQYIGPWLFLSHLLLAFFFIRLLEIFSVRGLVQLAATLIVVFNPVLLHRSIHPSLCAHWLIVGSLWVYFLDPQKISASRLLIYQGLLMLVGGLINPYFSLIGAGFFVAQLWRLWLFDGVVNLRQTILYGAAVFSILFVAWYVVGFFQFRKQGDLGVEGAYGLYAYNLNSLFNSGGWSAFFRGRPLVSWHQYESFMYLGAGMMGLTVLVILWGGYQTVRGKRSEFLFLQTTEKQVSLIPLLCFAACIGLFAITNTVTLDGHVLFRFGLADKLQKVADVFRASARYFWVIYYLIIIVVIVLTIRLVRHAAIAIPLLLAVWVIQLYDYKSLLGTEYVSSYGTYHPPLSEDKWRKIFEKMGQFVFYPPFEARYLTDGDYRYFSYLAADYRKPVTLGYAARQDNKGVTEYVDGLKLRIAHGSMDADAAFISTGDYLGHFTVLYQTGLIRCSRLDGYFIFYPSQLESDPAFAGLEKLSPAILTERQTFRQVALTGTDAEAELPREVERLERTSRNIFIKGRIASGNGTEIKGFSILLKGENNQFYQSSSHGLKVDSLTSRVHARDSVYFNETLFTDDLPRGHYKVAAYVQTGEGGSLRSTYSYLGNVNVGYPDEYAPQFIPLVAQEKKLRCWFDVFEDQGDRIKVSGWAFIPGQSSYSNRIEVVIRSGDKVYVAPTDPSIRPDVTSYFNSPLNLETCGFTAFITKKGLEKGEYEIGIRVVNDELKQEATEYAGRYFAVE